jgi:hypothetical protein
MRAELEKEESALSAIICVICVVFLFAETLQPQKKGRGSVPVPLCAKNSQPSGPDPVPAIEKVVLEPGERDDEQRREEKAEQRVQPDQRHVKAPEREANPDRAQRAMCFQGSAPEA